MKKKLIIFIFLLIFVLIPRVSALTCNPGSFLVTYNANGGKNASAPTCVSKKLSTIKPSRSGYKFLGWSNSKSSNVVVYDPGQDVFLIEDTTLYAVWAKKYTVTYNANGGTVSEKNKKVTINFKYGTLATPKRKGYTFQGWYTAKSGGVKIESDTVLTKAANHTIYAHWKKIKYTVTYELNGGVQNVSNKDSYNITTSTFKLYNPTKKGYIFQGWYKESSFKNRVYYVYKGTTGNKKFYAKWTPIKYTVRFYGNGYTSGSTKAQSSLKYNKTYTLNANGFKKTDYVYNGWNTASDGSGKTYTNKQEIKNLSSKDGKTIKLYAMWKRKQYTITYVLDGGILPTNIQTTYTKASDFVLKEPTREGYKFLGWYTDTTYTTKVTKIVKGTTGNKTFYAKWKFEAYLINYVLDGGTNPAYTPTTYTNDIEVALPYPTKKGYEFEGWYVENTFINRVSIIPVGSIGNKTFYAKWSPLPSYTISYVLNNGSNPSSAPTSYTKDDEVRLPTPAKNGYAFDGWYTESTFNNQVTTIPVGSIGNKTFYAKWSVINYSIIYGLNGGTNPNDAPLTYTTENTVTLPIPTKEGYSFDGWYTDTTFTNKVVSIPKGSIGNKKLYAKWNPEVYLITYNALGGLLPSSAITSYTIADEITLVKPARRGYAFLGWFTEEEFINQVTSIPVGTTGDIELFAKWQSAMFYSIDYVLYGGTNPSGSPTNYTIYDEVILPTPTKNGYGFDGWYTEADFINRVTTIPTGTTGDKTFYAKWGTIQTFNITYNLNGGTNPVSAPTTYTNYQTVVLPTPTKTGYTFEGWYTENTFKNRVISIPVGTTGNKTYYAKWERHSYERSYNYSVYNNTYDDYLTSKADIKNTLYNIMNEGYTSYTLYCNYSTVTACFNDFVSVTGNQDMMKAISDYVNPFNNYETFGSYRMSDGTIILEITYTYDGSQKTAINNKIDQIISSYNMSALSDTEKIRKIHDYIVNNTEYKQSGSDIYNAYGTLINGKSVCQGYTDAVALMLDRFNIPNLKVSSESHTWNLIYINNKWLHLDATWDDPVVSGGGSVLLHDYYLKTTSQLHALDTSEHTFNTTYYPEGNY